MLTGVMEADSQVPVEQQLEVVEGREIVPREDTLTLPLEATP